jgi:hypothetical protein
MVKPFLKLAFLDEPVPSFGMPLRINFIVVLVKVDLGEPIKEVLPLLS